MKKTRLALFGSGGRMGRAIVQLLSEDAQLGSEFEVVYHGSSRSRGFLEELKRSKPQVGIDFTVPESSLKIAVACAQAKLPLLVCTTGFTAAQRKRLDLTLKGRKWAYVANTSLGMEAFAETLKTLAKSLPPEYAFSIWEAHHGAKRDSPSGTAKMLAEAVHKASKPTRFVEVHSVRGGSEPGLHRVTILGPFERMELTHSAQDRKLFARGALVRARALLR